MAIDDVAMARELVEQSAIEEGAESQIKEPQYEDGFTMKSVVGGLFVGFIMLPGAIVLGLVAGQSLGPAAQWVTIVLFSEVMRRSFLPLKRQEVFILYYVAGLLSNIVLAGQGISGGPFGALIWNQYFIQSPQAAAIRNSIPHWSVPPAGSPALLHRTFFDAAWVIPILLLVAGQILGRLNWMSVGYFMFRLTSDIEKLPFPMAPVAASGATALAEASTKEGSWRWRVFSIGSMIGLVFGFFYVAVPVFTGVVFGKALQLIPIPFFDLTSSTETILPGAISGISGDLGNVMVGFVLPYHIILGTFVGSIFARFFPMPIILYHLGVFGHGNINGWQRGMNAINTAMATDIRFWLSVNIGLSLAVGIIGIAFVVKAFANYRKQKEITTRSYGVPPGRGDLPLWIPVVVWFVVTCFYIWLTEYLLMSDSKPGQMHYFPIWILIFYGLIFTPINSFISARMVGLTGNPVSFPYLTQMTVIESKYPYVDIWYAPIPLADYGSQAQNFRILELLETKFISLVKAEFLMLPVLLGASFLYWAFFWHTSPIPSPQQPYAQQFWPLNATFTAMFQQINRKGGPTWVLEAINYHRILGGIVIGLALYGAFSLFKFPMLFYYGLIGGVSAWPPYVIPQFIGAWLGRRYFSKRFGLEKWQMYAPVLMAGFACGTGLIGMVAIALGLIAKSVNYLPY